MNWLLVCVVLVVLSGCSFGAALQGSMSGLSVPGLLAQ